MGVSEKVFVAQLSTYIRERSIKRSLAKVFFEGLLDQAGVILYHIGQLLQVVCPVMERAGDMSRKTGSKPIVGLGVISQRAY
jgi:hypothetical protein